MGVGDKDYLCSQQAGNIGRGLTKIILDFHKRRGITITGSLFNRENGGGE
jgi:hypothetical protein